MKISLGIMWKSPVGFYEILWEWNGMGIEIEIPILGNPDIGYQVNLGFRASR